MQSPRWSATRKAAAPSANPAACTSVPPAWTTRATSPGTERDPRSVHRDGIDRIEGVLPRIMISAAARISSIEQVTPCRCSTPRRTPSDRPARPLRHRQVRRLTTVPFSTIRPAIFSASLLAAAPEIAPRAPGPISGARPMALIDHRDTAEAGLRVLTEPGCQRAPRPDRAGLPVVAGSTRATLGRTAGPSPFPSRAGVPRPPDRRRDTAGPLSCSSRAGKQSSPGEQVGHRRPSADHRPPPRPVAESMSHGDVQVALTRSLSLRVCACAARQARSCQVVFIG